MVVVFGIHVVGLLAKGLKNGMLVKHKKRF